MPPGAFLTEAAAGSLGVLWSRLCHPIKRNKSKADEEKRKQMKLTVLGRRDPLAPPLQPCNGVIATSSPSGPSRHSFSASGSLVCLLPSLSSTALPPPVLLLATGYRSSRGLALIRFTCRGGKGRQGWMGSSHCSLEISTWQSLPSWSGLSPR